MAVLALTIVLAGCGTPDPGDGATTSVPIPTTAPASPSASPSAAPAPTEADADRAVMVVTARAEAFVVYPRADGGKPEGLLARNDWNQPLALPVIDSTGSGEERWLRVRLPTRPNGSTGWVRARDVKSRFLRERIEVDLSEHVLTRYRDDEPVQEIRVGVGTPTYPTSPGRFFVWARLRYDPPGIYSVGALGLSGFSKVISDWVGGGRMAIHGTSDPTDRGRDVSHGCVRVYNAQMTRLADVAMGTPVLIRP